MRLALGLGLPPGGQAFDDAASRIISAFTVPPTAARAALINTTVVSLKSAGVWALLDVLYMFSAADSQAALINWKTPGTFDATLTDTPTFTTDRGFTGNGSSDALSSGFVPSTAGGVYTQNSAHYSVRTLNDISGTNVTRGIGNVASTTPRTFMSLVNDTSNLVAVINAAGGLTIANTDSSDHFVVNRSASDAQQVYKGGVSLGTGATTSNGLPTQAISVLRDQTVFSTLQAASFSCGGSLNSTQAAALYAAELAYMQAVGAA